MLTIGDDISLYFLGKPHGYHMENNTHGVGRETKEALTQQDRQTDRELNHIEACNNKIKDRREPEIERVEEKENYGMRKNKQV